MPKSIGTDLIDAEDYFSKLLIKKQDTNVRPHQEEKPEPMTITETVSKNINWNFGSEKLIKDSLLIGDLEHAVEVAMKCGETLRLYSLLVLDLRNFLIKLKTRFSRKTRIFSLKIFAVKHN